MTRRGLREAHAHLFQFGRSMGMVPLDRARSLPEAIELIRAHAAGTREPWILGAGMRVESWPERRYPSRAELDAASGGRPAALWSFDHHALVANSAALLAAGIDDSTPDPPNGRILRANGTPSGLLLEAAAKLVWERVPEGDARTRAECLERAAIALHTLGFDEVHDLLSQPWLGEALAHLERAGRLPVRVRLYPRLEHLEQVARAAGTWSSDRVRLAGAKVFADGTLNSRTAWMLEPYADALPGLERGQPMMSHDALRSAMVATRARGLDLAVHAIGDAAVRAALDAWESLGGSEPAARLRIEHAEVVDDSDVDRIARPRTGAGSIVCSVQPCHLLADIEALRRGLPHRLHRVLPLRDFLDAGCEPGRTLMFGSDVPIVRANPEDSILAATARRRAAMPPDLAIAPEQAISASVAWACY